jgi:hypothetical protein
MDKSAVAIVYGEKCYSKSYGSNSVDVSTDLANCNIVGEVGLEPTPEYCFDFDVPTQTINGFDSNAFSDPTCGIDSGPYSIVLPNTIGGIEVLHIGNNSFDNDNWLVGVNFNSSLQTIGISAFNSSQIDTLVIPSNVISIGDYAFGYNPTTSLTLNEGLTSIGEAAFIYNEIAGTVTIPNSVTSMGIEVFGGNYYIENMILGTGLSEIPDYFCYACGMTDLSIPNNITSIGYRSFYNSEIVTITFGTGVQTIDDGAFSGSSIETLILNEGLTSIGDSSFDSNLISSLTLPSTLEYIDWYAFYYNELTSLTLPSNITYIGNQAFNNNLLPDNQAFIYYRNPDTSIDDSILISYGGARTDNVIVPNNVVTIDMYAMESQGITSITFPSGLETIGVGSLFGNELTSITLPSNLINIGGDAFFGNNINSVEIPSSVTYVGRRAFGSTDYTSITWSGRTYDSFWLRTSGRLDGNIGKLSGTVSLPQTVSSVTITSINQRAFSNDSLTSVTIPSTVTSIGQNAFLQNKLTTVTFLRNANTVTSSGAFYNNGPGSNSYATTLDSKNLNLFGTWTLSGDGLSWSR